MLKDPLCLRRKQRYEAGLCLFWGSLFTGYGVSLRRWLGSEITKPLLGGRGPESVRRELLPQKGHRARTDYLFPTELSALKNKTLHTLRKLLTIPQCRPLLSHTPAVVENLFAPPTMDNEDIAPRVRGLAVQSPNPHPHINRPFPARLFDRA